MIVYAARRTFSSIKARTGSGKIDPTELHKGFQRHSANRHERPREYLRVAVFADRMPVDVMRIHTAVRAEQGAKAGRVEGRSGTKHPPRRNTHFCREPGGQGASSRPRDLSRR